MDTRQLLDSIARERVLILDGAMGTMVQGFGLGEADFRGSRFAGHPKNLAGMNDVLCLTRPDLIGEIHEAYLQAGADIIETCSFNATAVSLADYGLEDLAYETGRAAAEIARKAAGRFSVPGWPRFVAGSIGPTSKSGSIPSGISDPAQRSITWDELEAAFYDNARGLLDGGADLLLVETVFDTLNAKAAIAAVRRLRAERGRDIPLMISATITAGAGRIISGQSVEAFTASVMHGEPWALGFNCSFGAEKMLEPLRRLAASPCLVSAYPNAGFPDESGAYDQTPHLMCDRVEAFLREGLVNIVGGCCGSTPEHIARIAEMAKRYGPRGVPAARHTAVYAGLEALSVEKSGASFVKIGERTNVAGNAKFLALIREGNYGEALEIPREMIRHGAEIINIGMDDPFLDAESCMVRFVRLALADPELAAKPFMIDSSRQDVIEAAVKCIGGKPLINSVSLKDGEGEFLRRAGAARDLGAALVVMLFDEKGQAMTFERKTEIARRAWDLLAGTGFPAEDIVFDPAVFTVVTGIPEHDSSALAFIKACAWIREHCPGARISGGISNLSFSFRGNSAVREAMHAVFLEHAVKAGLDMAIVNPEMPASAVPPELRNVLEDLILCRPAAPGENSAADRLLALAHGIRDAENARSAAPGRRRGGKDNGAWRNGSAEERVFQGIVRGTGSHIEEDFRELLPRYPDPLLVLEGPLMRAMREVGDLFGAGEIYLPQIIRSARVMQKAVEMIKNAGAARGTLPPVPGAKILLATVRGDVHDIGKNIVSTVLGCNGFEVIDLGVQVDAETIAARAIQDGAAAVGISGLITPSLDEMVRVAREMERRRLKIPLLVGGATTSQAHTALRIAPEYSGPVVHVADASRVPGVLRSLLPETKRPRAPAELEARRREAAGRKN